MSPRAIVTGANSGIGHAFAEILIKEGYEVHALDLNEGDKMKNLGCKTYQCDLSSHDSIISFATHFKNRAIDILLNVAGIMTPTDEDTLTTTTPPILTSTFITNTYAPLLLTQSLLPSLLLSTSPKILHMSSRVGSIGDNTSGGSYAYRASKAALNSIGKSMAMDLKDKGVVVLMLHPGFVKTGLDRSGKTHGMKEAVEPEEAAGKLWRVVKGKGMEDTGTFWHREGFELPW